MDTDNNSQWQPVYRFINTKVALYDDFPSIDDEVLEEGTRVAILHADVNPNFRTGIAVTIGTEEGKTYVIDAGLLTDKV